MKIQDFMDLARLQEIQDKFSDATGIAAIAVDAAGNYITEASNFTDFCIKYTRGSEEGLKRCVKCDNECTGTYFCHAGLMDFSHDIVVNGEKLGAIIGGQVLPEAPDEEKFRQIAGELKINPDDYIRALGKVTIRSEKSIRAAADLLGDVVNEVINLAYMKFYDTSRLSTMEKELETATEKVEKINKLTKDLNGIASKQNILSLNASIESARAGVAGAGFTIVAKQMGDLTLQSTKIYKEISEAAHQIKKSVSLMNKKEHEATKKSK